MLILSTSDVYSQFTHELRAQSGDGDRLIHASRASARWYEGRVSLMNP